MDGIDMNKMEAACRVCGDKASGKHYGVASCDGCRGFFKRSIRRNLDYVCKEQGRCVVDVTRRNQCQACRFSKCLQVNMKKDAVQHERAPRAHISEASYHNIHRRHHQTTASLMYPHPLDMPLPGVSTGLLQPSAAAYLQQHLMYQHSTLPFKTAPTATGPFGFHLQFPPPVSPASPSRQRHLMVDPQNQYGCRVATSSSSGVVTSVTSGGKDDEVTSSEETRACTFRSGGEKDGTTDAKEQCDPSSIGLLHPSRTPAPPFGWQYALRPLDVTFLTLLPTENIYESAAKLLFLAVKWARSIPSFLQLSCRDQAVLLEEAWSELFVLSAAQWILPVNEESLVSGAVAPASRHVTLEEDARRLRETIGRFVMLRVDHTEYACLKALVLFKAESRGIREPAHVEMLQDQTHVMLHEYCATRHKARFGKLLLLLPSVHNLSRQSLEELFFKKTVGDVPIERLLGDMVKSTMNN